MTPAPVLPAGAEWATAPLLHRENVGRYVLCSWNSNDARPAQILKVGRLNIHADGRPFTVVAPHEAIHKAGGYTTRVVTYVHYAARVASAELTDELGRVRRDTPVSLLSDDQIRAVIAAYRGWQHPAAAPAGNDDTTHRVLVVRRTHDGNVIHDIMERPGNVWYGGHHGDLCTEYDEADIIAWMPLPGHPDAKYVTP